MPDEVTFTADEVSQLRVMVLDWVGEGFTTRPYASPVYDIFEKLDIVTHPFYDANRA